ncbi:hypothetical protein [Nonomuraea africana]|uniref:hypothetical protein n=1 Tax=Nonomuraea africana TaxID=46171 RepID=UPI0033FDA117
MAGRELLALMSAPASPGDELKILKRLAAERRVVIRLNVSRLYWTVLDIDG